MNVQMRTTAEQQIKAWSATVDLLGVGNRIQTKANDIAETVGFSRTVVQRGSILWRQLGMLKTEQEYVKQGQNVYWTVLVDKATGIELMRDFFERGGSLNAAVENRPNKRNPRKRKPETITAEATIAPEPVAMAATEEEETRAIAGPDAPSPFEAIRHLRRDEGEALIEAARQYAGRQDAIMASFDNLEHLGITIDREAAMKAIKFDRDDVLDAVSTLLPIIDRYEGIAKQVGEWKAELTQLRREVAVLRNDYNREKDANRRLSERNAILAGKGNGHATA